MKCEVKEFSNNVTGSRKLLLVLRQEIDMI